jgi:NAD(P)-dependent dehydrogenase (short-subunit alcohol dehydrogenase family)
VSAALVTGGGRGIGRAVARRLAADGWAVSLVARSADEHEDAVREVEGAGGRAVACPADVTDEEAVARAVARTLDVLGPVDVLVNNAGALGTIGPPWEADPGEWWRDVEVTLRGAFLCTRAVVPAMLGRRTGRVVNVSSYVAVRPSPYLSGYAAGKAALLAFTEALAAAGREHGLRAFAVAPGFVETAMTERLTRSEAGRRWLPEAGSGKRVAPERVAALVAFLASGRADPLSGRFVHALDDVDELARRADEIARDDLYAPRLRTLPGG